MSDPEKTDPVATLRDELLRDLPGDIKRVRNAYRRAAQQAALLRDAKDFTAHQTACKAGLGHLEILIKLLRWASDGDNGGDNRTANAKAQAGEDVDVEKLIKEARAALGST
ncbi:hypothetical protein [Thalassospira lucentensis]|uniref:Uncharacterized protein n=1 Tax=Thalassospira lucentensis TaxID=168935 RepID=A0A358HV73_9PROT|nr:hypothetical protein [Thalassospira lucentensis]HBU99077.1 hypothetical protein [Thalassospira lucentensis]HCW69981.1 hypothetical protein [Thalassospira lucentensis]|tara:strand:+ start:66 stop:398 length:333 start_codon:yes stop_codon:yes gene_type:complete